MQDTYNECYNKYIFVKSREEINKKPCTLCRALEQNICVITALQTEVFV